jgi:hypothetical protein
MAAAAEAAGIDEAENPPPANDPSGWTVAVLLENGRVIAGKQPP